MFYNVALNAFCQSTFDQSFVVDEIGVPSIDENDIDDDNMLELDIFRHEKEEEKKRKVLMLLMNSVNQDWLRSYLGRSSTPIDSTESCWSSAICRMFPIASRCVRIYTGLHSSGQ